MVTIPSQPFNTPSHTQRETMKRDQRYGSTLEVVQVCLSSRYLATLGATSIQILLDYSLLWIWRWRWCWIISKFGIYSQSNEHTKLPRPARLPNLIQMLAYLCECRHFLLCWVALFFLLFLKKHTATQLVGENPNTTNGSYSVIWNMSQHFNSYGVSQSWRVKLGRCSWILDAKARRSRDRSYSTWSYITSLLVESISLSTIHFSVVSAYIGVSD